MKIEIESPDDCPLRSNEESGGKCNVIKTGATDTPLTCEAYDDCYPSRCPLIDDTVEIERGRPK